ncbi:hypothetical protein [Desulfovibrio cuneatus]|uniref:hypothetical protein n=1 Tax=Desulfovibrio cuneatus TaxID=159728 RepID=UPI0003F60AC1|nr:hypothetical protein [Desulfovibrio cuneatus]
MPSLSSSKNFKHSLCNPNNVSVFWLNGKVLSAQGTKSGATNPLPCGRKVGGTTV